jgi:hypothetical protein
MQRHKLDFRNKKHQEQLAMFDRVIAGCDAQPVEHRRKLVPLEKLRSQAATARASHEHIVALRTALKAELINRKALFLAARRSATNTAIGLALNTDWQPSKMLAAGLDLAASTATHVGTPATPTNFRGAPTNNVGETLLRWKRTVRRCAFEIEFCTELKAGKWTYLTVAFRQSFLVEQLQTGGNYWFRIRATNSHGESAWSQPVCVRVK